jgi:hypothetical protein
VNANRGAIAKPQSPQERDQTPVTLDRLDVLHLATGLIWRDRIVNPYGVSSWPLGFAATRSRHGYVTVDRGE